MGSRPPEAGEAGSWGASAEKRQEGCGVRMSEVPPPWGHSQGGKGFFEDSLVGQPGGRSSEAGLPAPQARALPGRRPKMKDNFKGLPRGCEC